MYHGLAKEVEMLNRKEQREDKVQDPPGMMGPRTFGRGGTHRKTGAELAMRELERRDKHTLQSPHRRLALLSLFKASPVSHWHRQRISPSVRIGVITGCKPRVMW